MKGAKVRTKKQTIKVRGNLPNVAKYLLVNELKIFLIFDYDNGERTRKRGINDSKITNQSKAI